MILLEDILKEPDFPRAVEGLAVEFRKRHGLGPVHQLGVVVPDAVAAAQELSSRGLGPFFLAKGAPVRWQDQGEEKQFSGLLGLTAKNGVDVELLEPGQGSDFYARHLDPQGRPLVQHLGFFVPDVDAAAGKLAAAGFAVRVRGRIEAPLLTAEFAYLDCQDKAGFVVEFIRFSTLGLALNPPGFLVKALGRLQKLTGRTVYALD
ncbi:MAG: VOC family protein [Proteobacteria bacterium]|nr:VOC family protein [Pseudomonadota bacterium]